MQDLQTTQPQPRVHVHQQRRAALVEREVGGVADPKQSTPPRAVE
jgi:hypothetical protein